MSFVLLSSERDVKHDELYMIISCNWIQLP
jgi:hypothetical protein